MANYPTSVPSFTTKSDGQTISASHINSPQDEIVAIGTDLLKTFTTPAYSAGNFTASGSMTWGVDSGDITTLAYHTIGKKMLVMFELVNTDVGGTANLALYITIPGGFTCTKRAWNTIRVIDAGGTAAFGVAFINSASTKIELYKDATCAANWTLTSSDNTSIFGEIEFEIN